MTEIVLYMFPSMMLMWVFFIVRTAVSDIFEEKEKKTMQRMQTTPATVSQIIFAKYLRAFLLSLIVEGLMLTLTRLIFGTHWGNPFWIALVLMSANLSITGVLVLIYAFCKTKESAEAAAIVVIMFSAVLGGAMVPFNQLPSIMQSVGKWTIHYYGALGMQNVAGAKPLMEILKPVSYLTAVGMLSSFAGVKWLKNRFESGT